MPNETRVTYQVYGSPGTFTDGEPDDDVPLREFPAEQRGAAMRHARYQAANYAQTRVVRYTWDGGALVKGTDIASYNREGLVWRSE